MIPVEEIAAVVGRQMARITFERRGNKSEAHLGEVELAGYITAAAQVAIERYIELNFGPLGPRKPPKRAQPKRI